MFTKQDFEGTYLNFDDEFAINENDGNLIILGSNGIGKSSIYKTLEKKHSEYDYIDYDGFKMNFIKNKNKLIIGAQIYELETKYKIKDQIISDLHIKDNFGTLNVNSQKTAKEIFPELKTSYANQENSIKEFSSDKIELIINVGFDKASFLISNFPDLLEINNIDNEINNLRDEFIKNIYTQLDKILDDTDKVCPICGCTCNKPIKEIISEKKKKLGTLQNKLLKKYQKLNSQLTPDEIITNIKIITDLIRKNNIEKKDIIDYFVCGGNIENANNIIEKKEQLKNILNEIHDLEIEKQQFYLSLTENEIPIKEVFKNKFGVNEEKIIFDNQNYNIEILLPRNVDTYSTGEINLMIFTFKMYQFIASNKNVLIVDDPLSSYDISNQYRIIFDLVEITVTGKKVIIFSHNIDCVNIANTQHRGIFKYKYMEKYNGKLYLKNINLNAADSVLNISNLLNYADSNSIDTKYLKLLIEGENDLNAPRNKIFHYDSSYSSEYEGYTLTNDYLVSLIDDLNEQTIINDTFEKNAINKILYMVAIRIWIEKKFYQNSPTDESLHNKTFGEKIDYMFPRNNNIRWNGNSKVTRKYLMSKKTMINQHDHYKSQILPFSYALNLSLDELKNEIIDIKDTFGQQ